MSKLRSASRILLLFSLSILTPEAFGQVNGFDLDDPDNANLIRRQYRDSHQMPDGLAFMSLVNHVTTISSSDSETATQLIMYNTGLESDAATSLLTNIIEFRQTFQEHLAIIMKETGCLDGSPRSLGDGAFSLLESMDDKKDAFSELHYAKFKSTLDDETIQKFSNWIRDSKPKIRHITFDHRELALRSGMTDIDDRMYDICSAGG